MDKYSLGSFAGKETLRCLALAFKRMPMGLQSLSHNDENDLTFIGLVCLLFQIESLVCLVFISNILLLCLILYFICLVHTIWMSFPLLINNISFNCIHSSSVSFEGWNA